MSNDSLLGGGDDQDPPPKFTVERVHTTQSSKFRIAKETLSVEEIIDMEIESSTPPD